VPRNDKNKVRLAMTRMFRNVVQGFIGSPQKSQIFVGDFGLVRTTLKGRATRGGYASQ